MKYRKDEIVEGEIDQDSPHRDKVEYDLGDMLFRMTRNLEPDVIIHWSIASDKMQGVLKRWAAADGNLEQLAGSDAAGFLEWRNAYCYGYPSGTQPTERGVKHTGEVVRNKPRMRAEIARQKGMHKANSVAPARYAIVMQNKDRARQGNGSVTSGTVETRKRRASACGWVADVDKRVRAVFRSTKRELFCRGKELLTRLPSSKEITDAPELLALPKEEEEALKTSDIAAKCWAVRNEPVRHNRHPHSAGFKAQCKPSFSFRKVKATSFNTIKGVEAELSERGIEFTPRAQGGKLKLKDLQALLPTDAQGFVTSGRQSEIASASIPDPWAAAAPGYQLIEEDDEDEEGLFASAMSWLGSWRE
jgi:hypothetical protein